MFQLTCILKHLPTLQVILSILQGTFITTICRLILSLAAPRLCRQPFRSFASTSTQAHNHHASTEESLSPVSCSSVQDRPHPLLHSLPPTPHPCSTSLSHSSFTLHPEAVRSVPHGRPAQASSALVLWVWRKCSYEQLRWSIITAASVPLACWNPPRGLAETMCASFLVMPHLKTISSD